MSDVSLTENHIWRHIVHLPLTDHLVKVLPNFSTVLLLVFFLAINKYMGRHFRTMQISCSFSVEIQQLLVILV